MKSTGADTAHERVRAYLASNTDQTRLTPDQMKALRKSFQCSTTHVMRVLAEVRQGYVSPTVKEAPPKIVKAPKLNPSSPFILNRIKSLWQTHFPGKNQPSNTEIAHAAADARQDTPGWLKKFPADFVQLLVQVS